MQVTGMFDEMYASEEKTVPVRLRWTDAAFLFYMSLVRGSLQSAFANLWEDEGKEEEV